MTIRASICAALIVVLILASGGFARAGDTMTDPAAAKPPQEREAPFALRLFQKYISGIDGDRCSMYPSCSHYSAQAINRHGWVKGWIMTCDRLMRCGRDETHVSPPIMVKGRQHTYDPLDRNDIWKAKTTCSPHAKSSP